MTQAAICLPTIGTSSLRPLLRVTPPPLTSVEANNMTGIPAAFSCLTSDAYIALGKPEPNAAAGFMRTTVSHACLTLPGLPSVGMTFVFQPSTSAAFLIAFPIVVQTSTPQCTYVTVLPVGMGFPVVCSPRVLGGLIAAFANAWASASPEFFGADDAIVEVELLLLLLSSLLPQPAATRATATATSASATLKRRDEWCLVDSMLSSCLVMCRPVTGAAFRWTSRFQQPASPSCALARNVLSSRAEVRGARRP